EGVQGREIEPQNELPNDPGLVIRGQQVLQEHGRDQLLPIHGAEPWAWGRCLVTGSGSRLARAIGSSGGQRGMGFVGVHTANVTSLVPPGAVVRELGNAAWLL